LNFPNTLIPKTLDNLAAAISFELADLSEIAIQEALKKIKQRLGTIDSAIYLVPQIPVSNSELFKNNLSEQILKHLFFLSKHLQPEVTKNRFKDNERHSFTIVTHMDGQLGIGGFQWYDAVQGGYYGLLKTINVEWESVYSRIIDLAPSLTIEDQSDNIANELFDSNISLLEVGYAGNIRHTIGTSTQNHPELNSDPGLDINLSDVFIVPGGGKGVTAACVVQMAMKFKNKFILIGRSEILANEPQWAKGCEEINDFKKNYIDFLKSNGEKPIPKNVEIAVRNVRASREISNTIQKIESAGSQVNYYKADITNLEKMQQIVEKAQDQMGQITGVLHGAGVLADKHLHKKTEFDYDRVYQTKIKGLDVLMKSVEIKQLKHLILFSSAAGFYGNEAQSDYALANEVLNKTGHLIKQMNPDCHVISANWGPWDMGMVTPQLKKLFNERGIKVIPESAGTEILCNELSNLNKNLNQIVVGSSMVVAVKPDFNKQPSIINRTIDLNSNPTMIDHVIGGEAVLPVIFALSWIADCCMNQYPGYHFYQCQDMRVLKGIVLKQGEAHDYQMELIQLPETNTDEIQISVSVSSHSDRRFPVFHYKCNITLKRFIRPAPVHFLSTAMEDSLINKPEFYKDGTLFHGPSLQGIKKVLSMDDQSFIVNCICPFVSPEQQGQFPVTAMNQYVADIMLQSVVVWARKQYDLASLPLKIGYGIFYKSVAFGKRYIIDVEVVKKSKAKVISNIKCVDQQGHIFMELFDVEITLSKSLNQKFLENKM
jgi:NAD(P)-dependent dehydrogenase (short-subunit alcohol dehydrogenase family)